MESISHDFEQGRSLYCSQKAALRDFANQNAPGIIKYTI